MGLCDLHTPTGGTTVSYHAKTTTRSRRIPPQELDERLVVCRTTGDQPYVQLTLPMAPTMIIEGALERLMLDAGRLMIMGYLNEEVDEKAGKRYAHERDEIKRWGHEDGYAIIAGQKVAIQRPRLRGPRGEVPLTRYEAFRRSGRMQRAVAGKVLRRVSMRDYEGAIETFGAGYGIRKSSVSRHWVAASAAQLAALQTRRLEDLEIVAVMIDGIAFHGEMVLVALGVSGSACRS
jgi:putative transposase